MVMSPILICFMRASPFWTTVSGGDRPFKAMCGMGDAEKDIRHSGAMRSIEPGIRTMIIEYWIPDRR
jgi:hypothetical protein